MGHRIHALNPVMRALSTLGRGGTIWLVLGLFFFLRGTLTRAQIAALVLGIVLAVAVADYTVKPLVGRPRPFITDSSVHVLGGKPTDTSFPSSHSANAFAAAYVFARALPSARGVWWTLAMSIAVSRVYLGVHYPLDVGVGALIGVACGAFAWKLTSGAGRSPLTHRRAAP